MKSTRKRQNLNKKTEEKKWNKWVSKKDKKKRGNREEREENNKPKHVLFGLCM